MSEQEDVKEAILNFCDGMDAIVTKLRKDLHAETVAFKTADQHGTYHDHLNPPKDLTKPSYDVMKIVWTDAQGAKGPFLLAREEAQMSDENKQHWGILKEMLKLSGKSIFGKTEILWLFVDEKAIGRKKKESKP
jgi:hypothetical protein